jgi:hypothetical protein
MEQKGIGMASEVRELALQVAAACKEYETPDATVKRAEAYLEFLKGGTGHGD